MLAAMIVAHRARRVVVVVALSACVAAGPPGLAAVLGAQTDHPRAELTLLSQPAWHRPGDPLDIRVRITNLGSRSLRGLRLVVGVEDRVGSRSALDDSFNGDPGAPPSSFPRFIAQGVAPGERRVITLENRVTELALLRLVSDGGVYPLSIRLEALTEGGVVELDTLNIPLVYYPNDPQSTLKMSLLVPLNEVPAQDASGVFRADSATGTVPLEPALERTGWLSGLVGGLRDGVDAGLEVAVAPTPRLVEEIAAVADGYGDGEVEEGAGGPSGPGAADRWLAALRNLLGSQGVQRVLVPYAFPDLPLLERRYGVLGSEQVERQIEVGQETLEDVLDTRFSRSWLFPPAGRLDGATVEGLSLAGVGHVFGSDDSFLTSAADPSRSGCPAPSQSFTCPIRIATATGALRGYVSDPGLQERFAALAEPGDDRLDLQRLVAETAMIREEAPSPADRVVQATVPALWHPRPQLARRLFTMLARAPWLETVTPARGLEIASEIRLRPVVDVLPPAPEEPPAEYWSRLASADALTEHFAAIEPPPSLRRRLRRAVLVAQSRAWWMTREDAGLSGEDFVAGTTETVTNELEKISFIGKHEIILSSRRAPIQLVLSNNTGYPVTLGVDLYSEKLVVEDTSFNRSFNPGTRTIELDAVAQTSGTFPLNARIVTPEIGNDRHPIDAIQIQVRSTEFNVIALGITIGALAFLIIYYSIRALKRYERNRAAGHATS
jgi:uncharacterized protein DUF6049